MLKVINIEKSFNGKNVLNGINLEIKQGEVYGLIGANGAGKTTLFNIIARVINRLYFRYTSNARIFNCLRIFRVYC